MARVILINGVKVAEVANVCFTCAAEVADKHAAYCDECVAKQLAEQGDELAAFDAFHAYADRVAKGDK